MVKSILRFLKARRVSNVHAAHGMVWIFSGITHYGTLDTLRVALSRQGLYSRKNCPAHHGLILDTKTICPPPLPHISGGIRNTFVFNETLKIELALG